MFHNLGYVVRHFFLNGGKDAIIVSVAHSKTVLPEKIIGDRAKKTGIYCLDKVSYFGLLCIPPFDNTETTPIEVYQKALEYCKNRRSVLLVDPPNKWTAVSNVKKDLGEFFTDENAAIYFPRVNIREKENFVPCGAVAGIITRMDRTRGFWKSPAGMEASISGIDDLVVHLTKNETDFLNSSAVNCLKKISGEFVVWGARTMDGNNSSNNEWRYLAVRRTALFIEESLVQGLKWATFEPNDETLWSSIRYSVDLFMYGLFRQGALVGTSAKDAYMIKCDAETTTLHDIDNGVVNVLVGFAPLKPAEFVIIKIQLHSRLTEKRH